MARVALAGAGLVVAILVGWLVIASRPDSGRPAVPGSSEVSATSAGHAPDRAPPSSPRAGEPIVASDDDGDDAGDDAAALPTPEEVAEARQRVRAERPRPSHLSPALVMDHRLKAKPMRDARKAFQRGEYDVALARAEDALAVEPEANSARVLATLAACGLGDRAVARAHAGKLDPMRQGRVEKRCQALGVELDLGGETGEGARPTPKQ
jgi:hypothetical protein